jgi:hypothetical protein
MNLRPSVIDRYESVCRYRPNFPVVALPYRQNSTAGVFTNRLLFMSNTRLHARLLIAVVHSCYRVSGRHSA